MKPRIGLMVRGDRTSGPADRPETRLGPLRQALQLRGATCDFVLFAEDAAEDVSAQLMALDGVLVWINPIQDGVNRAVVDRILREAVEAGVWVSANPEVIRRMGTKEVLFTTRKLGWGTDTDVYRDPDDLAMRLLARLRRDGRAVLKQARGNGGDGVWLVDLVSEQVVADPELNVLEATRTESQKFTLSQFSELCRTYLAWSGCLVAQPYISGISLGMTRCYLVQGEVVGFCHQWPFGLVDAEGRSHAGRSPMEPAQTQRYAKLRALVEHEYVPQMLELLDLRFQELPAIWDADFLPRARQGDDVWALCEINVSAVWPFPPYAITKIVDVALERAKHLRLKR